MCCDSSPGQSKSVTNSTTTTAPPPEFMQAYNDLRTRAESVASQPQQTYSGPRIAGFTPAQMSAFNTINQTPDVATPFINQGADYTSLGTTPLESQTPLLSDSSAGRLASSGINGVTSRTPNYMAGALSSLPMLLSLIGAGLPAGTASASGMPPGTSASAGLGVGAGAIPDSTNGMVRDVNASTISPFMDPYTQQVVDATRRNFDQQNDRQRQTLIGNAISQGAWGGDRAGVAQAELMRDQSLAQDPVIAQLYSQGYQSALGAAQNQQQSDLARAGLGIQQEQVGLGQQNADTSRIGTTGNLSLGQQGVGLQGLSTGLGAAQAQDQSSLARANSSLSAYQNAVNAALQAAQGTNTNYLQAGQQYANLGLAGQNALLSGANAQLGAGTLQQQLAQNGLNASYEQWQEQQQYPFNSTAWLANVLGNLGSSVGGTSTQTGTQSQTMQQPSASPFSQVLGLGMAALPYLVARGGRVKPNLTLGDSSALRPRSAPQPAAAPHIPVSTGMPGSALTTDPTSYFYLPNFGPTAAFPGGSLFADPNAPNAPPQKLAYGGFTTPELPSYSKLSLGDVFAGLDDGGGTKRGGMGLPTAAPVDFIQPDWESAEDDGGLDLGQIAGLGAKAAGKSGGADPILDTETPATPFDAADANVDDDGPQGLPSDPMREGAQTAAPVAANDEAKKGGFFDRLLADDKAPWLMAGLSTMAGTSPHTLTNVAQGLSTGVGYAVKRKDAKEKAETEAADQAKKDALDERRVSATELNAQTEAERLAHEIEQDAKVDTKPPTRTNTWRKGKELQQEWDGSKWVDVPDSEHAPATPAEPKTTPNDLLVPLIQKIGRGEKLSGAEQGEYDAITKADPFKAILAAQARAQAGGDSGAIPVPDSLKDQPDGKIVSKDGQRYKKTGDQLIPIP